MMSGCNQDPIHLASVSPNQATATILSGLFYSFWNLFIGFCLPPNENFYMVEMVYSWICPVSWSLYGLVTSQFADIKTKVDAGDIWPSS
ncbi:ABC transporter G family member 38 [Cucumis melo var. makuwa]|uniref:ABC transporter G family member 38 n=1 Tax=Cucumis melo var. makuwa TaxID=1194695 RepID=A0A5D3C956_CUCMM|nr:ABC transporter G family member 38 [Cucumis melo var. makuwa]TYK08487.1 ABC transporter G family member 38 [Cucumis melo var. makuwa]